MTAPRAAAIEGGTMKLVEEIIAFHHELSAIRRDIHAHPETAYEEFRTSGVVAEKLEAWGLEVHRGLGGTGVVGSLRVGKSPRAIGLRADMDALPLQEYNKFEHRSQNNGKMHACGHDGHTSMLLGAAKYLSQHRGFDGVVHFIFQPAEEGGGGAKKMMNEGLFDKFPVEAVFGMHNWPGLEPGKFAVRTGAMMASSDKFDIVVTGKGAHAALPHTGVDPVLTACAIVQGLQNIVTRSRDPVEPAVISVTQVHAGDAYNVIPNEAVIRGTARAFSVEMQDLIESGMKRVVDGIAAAHGASAVLKYHRTYPPTLNHARETEIAARVMDGIVGAENVVRNIAPAMGSEDFSFMLLEKPGTYVWIGNGGEAGGCLLHNPHYDFNDEILALGATYWVRLVEHYLGAAS
jgi:hippurate hydrolase